MREPKPKKEKDGIYHIRFRVKEKDGKWHQKHFAHAEWKSGKDAIAFYTSYMKDFGYSLSKVTVNDLFRLYIANTNLKERTKQNRELIHEIYIEPTIGKMIAEQVDVRDINHWQNGLLKLTTRVKGTLLSDGYLEAIQDGLRTVLNYGVTMEYLRKSPFTIPNKTHGDKKKVIRHWTPEQFNQFIQVVKKPIQRDIFITLFWTGMRVGEVVALQVEDIDMVKGTIDVNKTYDPVNKKDEKTPKTANSCRKVMMTSEVKTIIGRLIYKHQHTYGYTPNAIVFGFDEHYGISTLQASLKKNAEVAGVPYINIHAFRHSHVFFLRQMRFNPFEIAKRIGDNIDQVNKTYGQWFDELQQEMVQKIDNFNNEPLKTSENSKSVANLLQTEVGNA